MSYAEYIEFMHEYFKASQNLKTKKDESKYINKRKHLK